jgi:2-oxoglutarate ferredoxin oxidoreductase subunit alpha
VIETAVGYRRYAEADSGLSPRGVPGFGEGLVRADSDEHDEEGFITEEAEMRVMMVDKRGRKLDRLRELALPPRLSGPESFVDLVVGWGSTGPALEEALADLGLPRLAHLHFTQVWPLHTGTEAILAKAKRILVVEGNASGQFAELLRREAGASIDGRILKYDGSPFSVEELVRSIGTALGR